eukprot:RCo027266
MLQMRWVKWRWMTMRSRSRLPIWARRGSGEAHQRHLQQLHGVSQSHLRSPLRHTTASGNGANLAERSSTPFPRVYMEVEEILMVYAPLLAPSFSPGAPLPALPPLPVAGFPPAGVPFQHASIAAHKALERIQMGQGTTPITRQPNGTVLVIIDFTYANAGVSIKVVRG